MAEDSKSLIKQLEEALKNPEIQKIYVNGFVNVIGNGDIMILLKNSEKSIAVLSLSYTVAKTLSIKLGDLISRLEERTGNTIMTTDDVDRLMRKGENK